MKKFLNIISYLAILFVVYIAILNAQQIINIQLWGIKGTASLLDLKELSISTNLAVYTFFVLIIGFFCGLSWLGQFYLTQKDKLNAYKRKQKKSSITNSSNSSKVEVLEAKIATLEKALKDALNK